MRCISPALMPSPKYRARMRSLREPNQPLNRLARQLHAKLGQRLMPGEPVILARVDERAVHVPEDGARHNPTSTRATADHPEYQCLKCRRPVNTIAIPCSSAAAITSASRIEPPGCTTARRAGGDHRVQPVAEREERIGRHDRPGQHVAVAAERSPSARRS